MYVFIASNHYYNFELNIYYHHHQMPPNIFPTPKHSNMKVNLDATYCAVKSISSLFSK